MPCNRTFHTQVAATTLTGTTGNNLLNAPGSVSTLVQGLAGADSIVLNLANDEADGGAGNDSISLVKSGTITSTVKGGAGNDTVFFRSSTLFSGFVDLGAGADSIRFATGNGTILNGSNVFGGEGNDTLRIVEAVTNSTVGAGSGADILSFSGGNAVTTSLVNGGKQKDTITLINQSTGSFATLNGGRGADIIQGTGAGAFTNSLIGGGKGTDSIRIDGAQTAGSVAGGGLADTIRIIGGYAGGTIFGDANGVTAAGTGTGGAADGADQILLSAVSTAAGTIYGGGGNDTITMQSGLLQTAGTANLVDGGNGADSITIVGHAAALGYGDGTITGGKGHDTIDVDHNTGGLGAVLATISGGAGTDQILVAGLGAGTEAATFSNNISQADVAAIISGVSGDTLRVATGTSFTANNANFLTGAPTIDVLSAMAAADTTIGTAGDIAVFSDGTDSFIVFGLSGNDSDVTQIAIKGKDIVLTTRTGQVTYATSNFGFTAAATASGGINATFS